MLSWFFRRSPVLVRDPLFRYLSSTKPSLFIDEVEGAFQNAATKRHDEKILSTIVEKLREQNIETKTV